MTEITYLLKELCNADGFGSLDGALNVAEKYLSRVAEVRRSGGNLIGKIKGDGDYTVMLDAHIDEIGMLVTSVNDGFVSVAAAGGIDHRMLAAMKVNIHGKETVKGVFCSVPPHLRSKETDAPKLDELYIDTGLGEKAQELICVGDRVTFSQDFTELCGGRVTGKSLDNRAGVAALIRCAEILAEKRHACNVVILLSDMEEVGADGAKVQSYAINPNEAVAVDVSFGDAPDIPKEKTGILGKGAMIGISPVLSKSITDGLTEAAKSIEAPYQLEVMGGRTSTNADAISVTKSGVPCGLLSIPLRNMHTPVEIVDVKDVETVANILAEYVFLKG